MSNFNHFSNALNDQFTELAKRELYKTSIDKEVLWEIYQNSFEAGTNPVFRERREHDCNCCKNFIRDCGAVVAIIDRKLVSIWDIAVEAPYQVVADAMSHAVKQYAIEDVFRHNVRKLGTKSNLSLVNDTTLKFEHFYFTLPDAFYLKHELLSVVGEIRTDKAVLTRSLETITMSAINVVEELITQGSLYKGDEFLAAVRSLKRTKQEYDEAEDKETYLWVATRALGPGGRYRNTAIGTLLLDLSDSVPLTVAVAKFEDKVAPANYKRSSALITKGMIEQAEKTVAELGLKFSLQRRYARSDDVTINNVLFANRDAEQQTDVFDDMRSETADKIPDLDKVEEVSIDKFVTSILPMAESIEVYLGNTHESNLVSLIAPVYSTSPRMFKWDNHMSWAYNGDVADSMRDRVEKAGGNIDGVLRFSIQWNDDGDNQNDFDAHCLEPDGRLIYYGNAGTVHCSTGVLDVDIINPGKNVAVENITWSIQDKMHVGKYQLLVHNYSSRTSVKGFSAEVAFEGKTYSFAYNKPLRAKEKIPVATVTLNDTSFVIDGQLTEQNSQKGIWGLTTNKFHKVKSIMLSPNYWDGSAVGNKHWFFMLEDCVNPERARGFYNEFLLNDLTPHRKVFEVLGAKTKAESTTQQLSGVGFSSTQRNHVLCRVRGAFNRVIKVTF